MRKRLLLMALFLIAAPALPASADVMTNYAINFTTSGSPPPTSGSFTYNSTHPAFSNFLVLWDGLQFDLTSSANAPLNHSSGCTGEASTPSYGFELMSETLVCPSPPEYIWVGQPRSGGTGAFTFTAVVSGTQYDQIFASVIAPNLSDSAVGTWTISPATVPELSGSLLVATGLLGFGARRKLQ